MERKKLRGLGALTLTNEMIQIAEMDVPAKPKKTQNTSNRYKVYIRSQVMEGILKVAFFLSRDVRMGATRPLYELFIDGKAGKFLTWDSEHRMWRSAVLENLDKFRWITSSDSYITSKENSEMKEYLGIEKDGYDGILAYQNKIREKELALKHKRKTDLWDKVMNQVPAVPKDWEHWVSKHGIHQHFIFYDYVRNGAKRGYCTYCKKEVPIKNPRHHAEGVCKCCGHKIQFKCRGRAGNFTTADEVMYLIQKCGEGFVIRQYYARRCYSNECYENPIIYCKEERRYVYNADFVETKYYYGRYRYRENRWIEGEKPVNGFSYYQYYRPREKYLGAVYKRTLPTLSVGVLGKTGLQQLVKKVDRINPKEYLDVLSRRPYLEQMAKADLVRLAWEVVNDCREIVLNDVNDFAKSMGIDKNRMKRLRKCNGGFVYLEWLKLEKSKGINISNSVIDFFEQNNLVPDDLEFIINKMTPVKICNYLKRQCRETSRPIKELVSTWQDYTAMADRLKMDLGQEQIYKPKELIKSHDDLILLLESKELAMQASEISKKYPDVDGICQQIKEKYEYGDNDYLVIGPDRIEDIIMEGQVLGHCLHSSSIYFERIQKKESYILFLRKASEPDKPYYTLEVEPGGTARQKRTVGDKQNADYEDAKLFIKKWQKEISKRLTREDLELAKQSAVLRVKEIAELRDKNVRIRHGHLAGKPLADVLEADLMEAELCARADNLIVEPAQEGEQKLCIAA